MATTDYGTDNNSADVTSADTFNKTLEATQPGGATDHSIHMGGGESRRTHTYTMLDGDPGLTTWPAGTYSAFVNISDIGADCTMTLTIRRINSSGADAETLATSSGFTTTGLKQLDWVNGSSKTVSAGDRLQISVQIVRAASHGNQNCTITVGTAGSLTRLTTPITTEIVLDAASGSYAKTGFVAGLLRNRVVGAILGTYNKTGADASFLYNQALIAAPGSYLESGFETEFLYDRMFDAEAGAYSKTGASVTFLIAIEMNAEAGSYDASGFSVTFLRDLIMDAAPGSYTESGLDASLLQNYMIPAIAGSYSVQGQDFGALRGLVMIADAGNYTVSGAAAVLVVQGGDGGDYHGSILLMGVG